MFDVIRNYLQERERKKKYLSSACLLIEPPGYRKSTSCSSTVSAMVLTVAKSLILLGHL